MNGGVPESYLDAPLVDFRGQNIIHPVSLKPEMSLREVLVASLLGSVSYEDLTDGDRKFARYKLAKRCNCIKSLMELDAVELETVRKAVGQTQQTLVVGAVWELLAQ